jgi:amino acid transporter
VAITGLILVIALVDAVLFDAEPFDTFLWSGTIGTLILIVVYMLATVGCIKLVFVDRLLPVPQWQLVIPLLALVILGYTLYRNVFPYPDAGPPRWFPVVSFGWLVLVTIVMLVSPGLARRLSAGLASADAGDDARQNRLNA